MKLEMQKASNAGGIEWVAWNTAFCGEVLDDRGKAAVDVVAAKGSRLVTLKYNPETFHVEMDGGQVSVDSIGEAIRPLLNGPVVLEATTLGFVELLLCCRALGKNAVPAFDVIYVEPDSYRNLRRRHLLHRRDFELSSEVPGYRAIPGNAILLGDRSPQKGVFFLGYEEARLRRAFEDLQMISAARAAVTFGVPAFKPGWEMDALANNIGVIREQNIRGGMYFCGAENPSAVIELLSALQHSLGRGERLFVAPIGTKPHGIGVALFVSQHPNVGVVYDHPRRTKDRTSQIAHWHRFSVREFSGAP